MIPLFKNFLARVGASFLNFLKAIGKHSFFILNTFKYLFTPDWRIFAQQLMRIGYGSLPVIGLTAIFTGMVLALQSYTGFNRFGGGDAIPAIVVLSMTRELAPVLVGLMVAGRVGASIAAEIASMRVSDQIDALMTLSVNPFQYLIAPRVLCGFVILPLLVFIADIIGILGGYLVSTYQLDLNPVHYIDLTFQSLQSEDVISGLIKAFAFGGILTMTSCYFGYHAKQGALGVGRSTTQAVVTSSVLILFADYLLTNLLFHH